MRVKGIYSRSRGDLVMIKSSASRAMHQFPLKINNSDFNIHNCYTSAFFFVFAAS